jgi:Fur family peroxide stress response transcriptional regulator
VQTQAEARYDHLVKRLRERGHRVTPQRLAILHVLSESEGHPSAEQVYARIRESYPTTSLGTVYKVIGMLKELGEVLELGFADDSNRYDGNKPYPHPHLICVKCRTIIDPEIELLGDLTREVAQRTGYEVLSHRLDFYGLCPACRQDAGLDQRPAHAV